MCTFNSVLGNCFYYTTEDHIYISDEMAKTTELADYLIKNNTQYI